MPTRWLLVIPTLGFTMQLGVNGQKPLFCDSINSLSLDQVEEFMYLTTNRDCAFVFQSPSGSSINLRVNGVNRGNESCTRSPSRIYYYFRDNLAAVNEIFCDKSNDLTLVSDSNFALINSPYSSGSFVVRISALLKPRAFLKSEPIIGLLPPPSQPPNLFIPPEFRAQPIQNQGFVPSFGVPGLFDSYGAPLILTPEGFTGYPGVPTISVEFTTAPTLNDVETVTSESEMTTPATSTIPIPVKISSSTTSPPPSVSAFASTSTYGNPVETVGGVVVNGNRTQITVDSTNV